MDISPTSSGRSDYPRTLTDQVGGRELTLTIILAVYATHIQDAARQRGFYAPTDQRAVIPDDELPF